MNGDNPENDNFLRHLLDPHHVGQALTNLVRGIIPQHPQLPPNVGATSQSSSQDQAISDIVSTEQGSPVATHPRTIDTDSPLAEEAIRPVTSNTISPPDNDNAPHTTSFVVTSANTHYPSHPSNGDENMHDVEMAPAQFSGSSGSLQSNSNVPARGSRRARVEDDGEDADDSRESNRQRMHSPTSHDDAHHFMPIPEDHGVYPLPSEDRGASSQRHADPQRELPQHGPAAPPHFSRMMMSFDFVPLHPPEDSQRGEGDQRGGQHHHHHHHHHTHTHHDAHDHDGQHTFNFFINFPASGHGPAPPVGGAPNTANGGNLPGGNPGFMFPPFPFPFGIDMMEERDDPTRAKRLVNGLEEVPCGLVKRMERAGGPGTARGEVPTCSVCWESLLDPEGGGFEGNAELAESEAAEAARDESASQQASEPLAPVEGVSTSSPNESSASGTPSSSTTTPDSDVRKHPKIVVLPCSHAFHATCLQPWFSKPGRTTCPSCRFDIDPDSLTYRPRPLRHRRRPDPAPQGDAAAPTQLHFHPMILPVPLSTADARPRAASLPPSSTAQSVSNATVDGPPVTFPHPQATQDGQQRQQVLPPFVTFDISMIIPIFPGRAPDAALHVNGAAAGVNPTTAVNPQGPAPAPPRTDNNGFRLDDPLLQDAVRTTFERLFGLPAPPVLQQPTPADGTIPHDRPWFTPGFPPMPPMTMPVPPPGTARPQPGPQRHVEKRPWAPPPAPGPTLRQVVERNEREMGLRCSDISCGIGPSDDDPMSSIEVSSLKQIAIHSLKTDGENVCEHKFHPACIVSAGRIAGWGHEIREPAGEGDDEDVEVSCPVCRALGKVSRSEWEEGMRALA